MQRFIQFLAGLLLSILPTALFCQEATITLKLSGVPSAQTLVLGRYDFDLPYKVDSMQVTPLDSTAVFSLKKTLATGLYFFYLPNQVPIDFIINGDTKMEFSSHATAMADSIQSVYSIENAPYFFQKRYKASREEQIKNLNMAITMISRATKDPAATTEQKQEIVEIYKDISDFEQQQPAKYAGTFYAKLMAAKNLPAVPENILFKRADGTANPAYLNYVKANYWKNYDFETESLNRSPIFKEKLDIWLNLHEFNLDTLYQAIASLTSKTKVQKSLYNYTLRSILTRYETANAPNSDAVFVHLFDTYYKNDKSLVEDAIWQRIEYKAELWRPTLLGKIAPSIELRTLDDQPFSLKEMDGKLIMLYFFSPQCAHCREWTPQILDLTKAYLPKGLTVVAVTTDGDKSYWKKYVKDHNLDASWTCVFDEHQPSALDEKYATVNLPNVFFLNADKKIIAKQIPMQQIGQFFEKIKFD